MPRLLLVRHGHHDLVGRVLAGRMAGVALSARGRAEAETVAARLRGCGSTRLLCSPMERCRQTAAPLAAALALRVEPCGNLDELDCGEWTGLSFDVLAADSRWQAWNAERGRNRMPGGETIGAVETRVSRVLDEVARGPDELVVGVTHSDVIKVAILSLLRGSLDLHDRLEVELASVTTLDLWPGGGKLVRSNEGLS